MAKPHARTLQVPTIWMRVGKYRVVKPVLQLDLRFFVRGAV